MKKTLLALAAVLALTLTACGQKEEAQVQTPETVSTTAVAAVETTEATEAPTTEPPTEPTEPLWKDNIIRPTSYETHYDPRPMNITRYTRNQITEVTFLDTLADMPEEAWDCSAAGDGSVMSWVEATDSGYHMYVAGEGGVAACPNYQESRGLLIGYPNLKTVNFNGAFHTEECTDFGWMFAGCTSLEYVDFTGIDTTNVTCMTQMFESCESLETLDLSCFDTSNVTEMSGMFSGCSNLKKLNTDGWDTANVTNMHDMFGGAKSLTELDLSHWNTSSVTEMNGMFQACLSLHTLNISGWNTSNVTDMGAMFNDAPVTELAVEDWDVSNVTNMQSMFKGTHLTSLDLSKWDTSKVENMHWMFIWMPNLNVENLELGEWEVDSIKKYDGFISGNMYKGQHYNKLFN